MRSALHGPRRWEQCCHHNFDPSSRSSSTLRSNGSGRSRSILQTFLYFILVSFKVDLLDGKASRAPGVSYLCHIIGGKHTCVEKDVEVVPLEKIVTVMPRDSFGISNILSDYTVETVFHRASDLATLVEISHYYSTPTLKAKLLNLVVKGRIARETQDTLNAAKAAIEMFDRR